MSICVIGFIYCDIDAQVGGVMGEDLSVSEPVLESYAKIESLYNRMRELEKRLTSMVRDIERYLTINENKDMQARRPDEGQE